MTTARRLILAGLSVSLLAGVGFLAILPADRPCARPDNECTGRQPPASKPRAATEATASNEPSVNIDRSGALAPVADSRTPPDSPVSCARREKNPWLITGTVCLETENAGCSAAREPLGECEIDVELTHVPATRRLCTVRSDARGRFRIDLGELKSLSPIVRASARVELWPRKSGLAPWEISAFGNFPVNPGAPFIRTNVSLSLAPGAVLHGRVLTGTGQISPEGGSVHLVDPERPCLCDGDNSVPIKSAAIHGGHYRIPIFKLKTVHLCAARVGIGVSRVVGVPVTSFASISVPDLVLGGGGIISGIALYPDGSPARWLPLRMQRDDEPGESPTPAHSPTPWVEESLAVTGADGLFQVSGLAPGRYALSPLQPRAVTRATTTTRRSQHSERYRSKTDFPLQWCRAGDRDVRFQVTMPRVIIRTVDDDLRPVGNPQLEFIAWSASPAREARTAFYGNQGLYPLHDVACLVGSAAGDDAASSLMPGTFSLFAEPGSFWVVGFHIEGMEAVEKGIDVPHGPYETVVDLHARRLGRPGTIVVHCRDDRGNVIPHFLMGLMSGAFHGAVRGFGGVRQSGEEIASVPPGRYLLVVMPIGVPAAAPGASAHNPRFLFPSMREITVLAGRKTVVTQTIATGASLRIFARLPDSLRGVQSRAPRSCSVSIPRDGSGRGFEEWSTKIAGDVVQDGGLRVLPVPVGKRQVVRIEFDGFSPVEVILDLEAGRMHEIDVGVLRYED